MLPNHRLTPKAGATAATERLIFIRTSNFTRPGEKHRASSLGGPLRRPLKFLRGQHPRHRHCNTKRTRYDAAVSTEGCAKMGFSCAIRAIVPASKRIIRQPETKNYKLRRAEVAC